MLKRPAVRSAVSPAKVWLVGAGPGDPDLLTLRAARLIAEADVIAYDELVPMEIRSLARADAEQLPVGRRANGCRYHEARIHEGVIARAREGKRVVRLKGGDPMIFGRGGEEMEELTKAGIPCEVVPGITAALGAASAGGFPLTHRDHSSMVTFATAHFAKDESEMRVDELARELPRSGTVVLYMGLGSLDRVARALIRHGRAASTPAAAISEATLPTQRIVAGTLDSLPELVAGATLPAPTLIVIGDVTSVLATSHQALRPPPASEPRLIARGAENDRPSERPRYAIASSARARS